MPGLRGRAQGLSLGAGGAQAVGVLGEISGDLDRAVDLVEQGGGERVQVEHEHDEIGGQCRAGQISVNLR